MFSRGLFWKLIKSFVLFLVIVDTFDLKVPFQMLGFDCFNRFTSAIQLCLYFSLLRMVFVSMSPEFDIMSFIYTETIKKRYTF